MEAQGNKFRTTGRVWALDALIGGKRRVDLKNRRDDFENQRGVLPHLTRCFCPKTTVISDFLRGENCLF